MFKIKVQPIVRLHSPIVISNNGDCTSSDDDACDMDMDESGVITVDYDISNANVPEVFE
ncbi:MAG: hypothetical protein GY931_15785 [Maribacter sp.]|nr:hypothetical protein [Maribacter sp.]